MSTLGSTAKMFKEIFAGDRPEQLAVRNKPALSRLKKVDDLDSYPATYYPIRTHLAAGVTHTFSNAQDDETSNDIYRIGLTAKDTYVTVKLVAKEMAMSRKNIGAYLKLKAKETEDRLEAFGQTMEREFWQGTHVGSVTAAPTNVAGSTYLVTLADATDIINIERGMSIGCWDTSDASSATQRAETCTVTKVNHSAGTFEGTFTGNPATWGTDTDYLFVAGTRSASEIKGWTSLNDYIPSSNPSSGETFSASSLDRTSHLNYLSGWRGTEYATIEETAQQLAVTMAPVMQQVAGSTEFWLHAKGFQKLQAEAGARLIRDQGSTPELGYTNCKIATAFGSKKVMTGPFVKSGVLWLIDWDGLSIRTNGPLLHVANEDGLEMLRLSTADTYEQRWRSWSNVLCDKMISQGRAPYSV